VARTDIPEIRRTEQRNAAKAVGVEDVRFLGYPDGRLELSLDLRRDISRVIRQVRPQRVLTQSPERNWARIQASHPDHLTTGEAALRAIYPDARNPFAFPELLADESLEPWEVAEVWVMAHPAPNHHVDVTDTFDRKIAALRAHVSQTAHMDDLEIWLRERLGDIATEAGLPAGHLAEAFAVYSTA
jgi:LmbE family N-acetylglucosaminyl deacetylase